jgi:hypothetical protein
VQPGIVLTRRDSDNGVRPDWALDGSLLAFRKLKQLVPEYKKWLSDSSQSNRCARRLRAEEHDQVPRNEQLGRRHQ